MSRFRSFSYRKPCFIWFYLFCLYLSLFPVLKRILKQLRIIISSIARHLISYKVGLGIRFILRGKFHFSHNKSLVVAKELIYLKRVFAIRTLNEPTTLVDNTATAQFKEMLSLIVGYLLFKLITRQALAVAMALDSKP